MKLRKLNLTLGVLAICLSGTAGKSFDVIDSDQLCGPKSKAYMADTSLPLDVSFLMASHRMGVRTFARYLDYFPATENYSTPPDEPDPSKRRESRVGKTITSKEVNAVDAFGMNLLLVFQHHNNKVETFTMRPSRGTSDANRALDLVTETGLPPGGMIYFGIDMDFVGPPNHAAFPHSKDVYRYFDSIAKTFIAREANRRVGIYGSGYACQEVIARLRKFKYPDGSDLAGYCWLSNATGHWGSDKARKVFDRAPAVSLEQENMPIALAQHREGTCEGLGRAVDFSVRRPGIEDVGAFSLR